MDLVERLRSSGRGLCSENLSGYIPRGVTVADCIEAADRIEQADALLREVYDHGENWELHARIGQYFEQ